MNVTEKNKFSFVLPILLANFARIGRNSSCYFHTMTQPNDAFLRNPYSVHLQEFRIQIQERNLLHYQYSILYNVG